MKRLFTAAFLCLLGFPFAGFAKAQSRPAITGIAFARFYTTDAAGAQRFYGEELGFQRHEAGGEIVYPVNRLQWLEITPRTPPKANDRLEAVAFMTRDAVGLETYLKAKGVAIAEPMHGGEFGVRDPEGNLVIFVQSGTTPMGKAETVSAHATSERIIHVGFLVQSRAKEDAFWKGILGFRPYWYGGQKADTDVDYVSLQVPDGTDWLEYMLNQPPDVNLRQHGVMNHFSLGVEAMDSAVKKLAANQCTGPECSKTQVGRDGKVQLNLYDPDMTRVEFMEFKPSAKVCCSPFTGKHPTETEDK
jgi:catechol 2,3-dioxygenase-like lactoylglutathione lyase family enzyme